MPKLELGVSLQTWINPFLIAGIKEVAVGLMCFTPGSNLDYDASFEEKATMFGKTLHRDDRTAAAAEALKIANQSDVIVAHLANQQK
jgi:beta-glucosidase